MSQGTTPSPLTAERQRQQAIEAFCVDRGVKRFKKQYDDAVKMKGTIFNTRLGKAGIRACIEPLAERFDTFLNVAHASNIAKQVLKHMDPPTLAFLTARAIIDFIAVAANRTEKRRYIPVTDVASKIAEYILDQAKIDKTELEIPAVVRRKKEREKKTRTSNYDHRHRSWTALFNKYLGPDKIDLSEYDLPSGARHRVGALCIRLFMRAMPGYIQEENLWVNGDTIKVLIPTTAFLEWIKNFNAACEGLHPVYMPTVIRPKPWSRESDHGGYWFDLAQKHRLIRSKIQTKPLSDVVYQALNALQQTPWMINKDIYEVIEAARQLPNPPEGIPSYKDEDVPARFPDDRWAAMSEEERRKEKSRRHELYNENHVRKCKRREFDEIRKVAKRLLGLMHDEGRNLYIDEQGIPLPFFFPHNLDFRGRFYPLTNYLHPQGNDVCRGLLRFHEGKRLGTQAAVDHLAVHGANCMGTDPNTKQAVDKLPRQERIEWVHKSERHIIAAAEDWQSNMRFWAEADSPFQFLAFCFEWAGFVKSGRSLDFRSHLPVTMDGTCNGLQHIAAITRDRKLAESVNLTRSTRFHDVYGEVATGIWSVLERWAFDGNPKIKNDPERKAASTEHTRYWISRRELITRSLAKPATMTLAYGSTPYRRGLMVQDYISENGTAEDKADNKRIATLAAVVEQALDETVAGARQLQDYLEGLITRCGAANRLIEWVAPSGFHVVQANFEPTIQRVETHIAGGITWELSVQEDVHESEKAIDDGAQETGITPNVIHSIDAAHMAFVIAGSCHTVSAFMAIHDCFGTHAADAPFLATMIRLYFSLIHTGEYSPHRGMDAQGFCYPNRPWDGPYSPALRLCYVRKDGEPGAEYYTDAEKAINDGGSLLAHIARCITQGPYDKCPVDLSEAYEQDELPLEVQHVPFDPFETLPDVLVDDRQERPREARIEAELAARPKTGDYGPEEAQYAEPFV